MERYEARAFISEVRELLHKAANAADEGLTTAEEDRLLYLEEKSAALLDEVTDQLRISASDGPIGDDANIRLEPIAEVSRREISKALRIGDALVGLTDTRWIAYSASYEAPDGRSVRDSVSSSAEGFIERDGIRKPFGAASALVARLLEPLAEGLIA